MQNNNGCEGEAAVFDLEKICVVNNDFYIPFNISLQGEFHSLFLLLTEGNINNFKELIKNKSFKDIDLTQFISKNSNETNIPQESYDYQCLLTRVTKDLHMMKNIIFAYNMKTSLV